MFERARMVRQKWKYSMLSRKNTLTIFLSMQVTDDGKGIDVLQKRIGIDSMIAC